MSKNAGCNDGDDTVLVMDQISSGTDDNRLSKIDVDEVAGIASHDFVMDSGDRGFFQTAYLSLRYADLFGNFHLCFYKLVAVHIDVKRLVKRHFGAQTHYSQTDPAVKTLLIERSVVTHKYKFRLPEF